MNVSEKTDQAAKSIEEFGYAVIKNVFSEEEANCFLKEISQANKKSKINFKGITVSRSHFLHISEIFLNILSQDQIFSLCQRICGDRCRMDHAFYAHCKRNENIKKGESLVNKSLGSGIHGGVNCAWGMNFYRSGYPININFPRTNRLNIHISLTDTGIYRGGLQLIPSTHVGNYNFPMCKGDCVPMNGDAINADLDNILIPQSKKGDIIIFLDSLLHGTSFHRFDRHNLYFMITSAFTSMYPYSMTNKKIAHLAKNDRQKQMLAEPCAVPEGSLHRTLGSIQ